VGEGIEIRTLRVGEEDALRACMNIAFHDATTPEAMGRWLGMIGHERTAIAFAGERMVGTSGAFSRPLSLPGGGSLGCAGITIITVLPTHRRRGILRRMMARLLEQAVEAGEPLAGLWAAEGGIYGRFGFGVASLAATVEMPGGSGTLASGPSDTYAFELVPPADAPPLLEPVWDALRAGRAGVPARDRTWWTDDVLYDPEDGREGGREQRVVVARSPGDSEAGGAVAGYALYRAHPAEPRPSLEVIELHGVTSDAEAALWEYVRSVDLVSTIVAKDRPLDDPLLLRPADAREPRVTAVADALWLRLVDVSVALERRGWVSGVPLDLTLAVTDDQLPANSGPWRLEVSADGTARCSPTDAHPDLTLPADALGAAYLGGTTPLHLLDAARLTEHTPGSAEHLTAALRTPRLPYTPDHF